MARDFDLLLSILPFERDWYAQRVPQLAVEFVGHPILNRYKLEAVQVQDSLRPRSPTARAGERRLHPAIGLLCSYYCQAAGLEKSGAIGRSWPMRLPEYVPRLARCAPVWCSQNDDLAQLARGISLPPGVEVQTGQLASALADATLAIASTGTVTLECAYFRVPTVAMYKTSWPTYWIAKQLVQVPFLAMPNLLAGSQIVPEFIQQAATAEHLAHAALELLRDPAQLRSMRAKLAEVTALLGEPGASGRAADAILERVEAVPKPLAQPCAVCESFRVNQPYSLLITAPHPHVRGRSGFG